MTAQQRDGTQAGDGMASKVKEEEREIVEIDSEGRGTRQSPHTRSQGGVSLSSHGRAAGRANLVADPTLFPATSGQKAGIYTRCLCPGQSVHERAVIMRFLNRRERPPPGSLLSLALLPLSD